MVAGCQAVHAGAGSDRHAAQSELCSTVATLHHQARANAASPTYPATKRHNASETEFSSSNRSVRPSRLIPWLSVLAATERHAASNACPGTVGPSPDRNRKDADGHFGSLAVLKQAQHTRADKPIDDISTFISSCTGTFRFHSPSESRDDPRATRGTSYHSIDSNAWDMTSRLCCTQI